MSRRTIVRRRPQRQPVFVPLWLRRVRMADCIKALDPPPGGCVIHIDSDPSSFDRFIPAINEALKDGLRTIHV